MALRKVCFYGKFAKGFLERTRCIGRSYATAAPLVVPHERSEEHARAFRLYTKSHISTLFERFAPGLDPEAYLAAAHVFPMRANNYVVEDLIDWSVFESLYSFKTGMTITISEIWTGDSDVRLNVRSTSSEDVDLS